MSRAILAAFLGLVFVAGCEPPRTVQLTPPGIQAKETLPNGSTDAFANGEQGTDIDVEPKQAPQATSTPDEQGKKAKFGTTNVGFDYTITKEGSGAEVRKGQSATVHYVGYFTNGKKFDSSRDRKQPLTFTLGSDDVIEGWSYLVEGMKVGEIRKAEIPSKYAYGEKGRPPKIPPNSPLIFEIELLGVR